MRVKPTRSLYQTTARMDSARPRTTLPASTRSRGVGAEVGRHAASAPSAASTAIERPSTARAAPRRAGRSRRRRNRSGASVSHEATTPRVSPSHMRLAEPHEPSPRSRSRPAAGTRRAPGTPRHGTSHRDDVAGARPGPVTSTWNGLVSHAWLLAASVARRNVSWTAPVSRVQRTPRLSKLGSSMSPASAARISGTPAATSRVQAPSTIDTSSAPSSEARTIQRLISSAVGVVHRRAAAWSAYAITAGRRIP